MYRPYTFVIPVQPELREIMQKANIDEHVGVRIEEKTISMLMTEIMEELKAFLTREKDESGYHRL